MARNTSLSLGDHFADFIDEQVNTGRYGSASEVVRAGLRLLEENEGRLRELQAALIAGEESGRAQKVDRAEFLKARRVSMKGAAGRNA